MLSLSFGLRVYMEPYKERQWLTLASIAEFISTTMYTFSSVRDWDHTTPKKFKV